MKFKNTFQRYGCIAAGCAVFAIGFEWFIKPAGLSPGGVSGIAVMVSHYYPEVNSGGVIFFINLPLLLVGLVCFGREFLYGTVWATLITSFFVGVAELLHPAAFLVDTYTASVLGGAVTGIGMGIVFREQATTGGTDIIVRLIQKKFPHVRGGYIFLIVDSVIVLASGYVFRDFENVLYSSLCLILCSLVFNAVYYFKKERSGR